MFIEIGLLLTSLESLHEAFVTVDTAVITWVPKVTHIVTNVLQVIDLKVEIDSFRYIWYNMIRFVTVIMITAIFIQPTTSRMISEVIFAVEVTIQRSPEEKIVST